MITKSDAWETVTRCTYESMINDDIVTLIKELDSIITSQEVKETGQINLADLRDYFVTKLANILSEACGIMSEMDKVESDPKKVYEHAVEIMDLSARLLSKAEGDSDESKGM